jgi:hypothetical protein
MDMSAKLLAIYDNECQIVSTLNERVPTLSRFTGLKSTTLVGFSTLPWQSGDVVALYQAKVRHSGRLWHFTVVTWQRFTVVTWQHDDAAAQRRAPHGPVRLGIYARASWKLQAGQKLQAASWTCNLFNLTSCELDGIMKLQ